jgi:hypothetical protein
MVKTVANVFELPRMLGILQYVEYDPSPRECANDGCLYEGLLTAEGCKKGVCVRYRVWVYSRDRKNWSTEDRRMSAPDYGGCISQAVADALWDLASHYNVGVWYDYQYQYPFGCMFDCKPILEKRRCGITINGTKLPMPYCSSVKECIELALEYYRREVEKMKEPPIASSHNPAEELLKEWPELEAFGTEWVRKWAPHAKERLVEIAKVLRRYPWMAEVVKKKKTDSPNPYAVEAYVATDGSEVCLLLAPSKAYCARNGSVKALPLELLCDYVKELKKMVCRPKGLLAYATAAKEYVKIL